MNLIETLKWRYAVKRMTGQKVPDHKIKKILEAIHLSASSSGLQPYKIMVISNQELKTKIHELAAPQPQVKEGSHLLVFASFTTVGPKEVDHAISRIAEVRELAVESLAPFAASVKKFISGQTREENEIWAAKQTYIALAFGLIAAAAEAVDATPMEGFNPETLDKLLGLQQKGLHSVAIMALGYRDDEKDFLAKAKKVRKRYDDLFLHYD